MRTVWIIYLASPKIDDLQVDLAADLVEIYQVVVRTCEARLSRRLIGDWLDLQVDLAGADWIAVLWVEVKIILLLLTTKLKSTFFL